MQYTLFVVLAPLAAVLSVGVLAYARRYRPGPETSALTWLMLPIAGWLIFNTFELVSISESATVFWAKMNYFFITSAPVTWLAFALQYTGRRKCLSPRRFILLWIIPAITVPLALTSEWHTLIWQSYTFSPVNSWLAMSVVHGPWFWVSTTYSYVLVFLGAFLISRQYFRSFALYRRQSVWLVIGALSPIVANIVYLFDLIPGLKKDYTPISFAFGGLAFAIGMFRYRLFDLRPVARDAVVDGMSDAMLVLDLQDRVVDLNPAARDIIGLPGDAVIGQSAAQVLHPWQALVERFREAWGLQTDIVLDRAGARRHYDLRISPLADRQGRLTGRLIVLRDITARVQAEEDLRQRTAELEARNEELDAFTHTVAHGLKSPLAGIVGYAELAEEDLGTRPIEALREDLHIIIQSGRKMTAIVDDLLLLASVRKLEGMDIDPLDMATIVTDALGRLVGDVAEHRARIVLSETWPTALGYGPWVEEVWVNYLSNALKYGGQPPRVELGADRLADQSMIRFWVRDNGPGVPPEEQERLFMLFTRLDPSRAEGHGLGLSIVQRIVERLGGEVGVESQIDRGSLFWFTLPAQPA